MASGNGRDTVTGHVHDARALIQNAIDEIAQVHDDLLKLKTDDGVFLDEDAKKQMDKFIGKLGRAINILI